MLNDDDCYVVTEGTNPENTIPSSNYDTYIPVCTKQGNHMGCVVPIIYPFLTVKLCNVNYLLNHTDYISFCIYKLHKIPFSIFHLGAYYIHLEMSGFI